MKKILFVLAFIHCLVATAQSPQLNVKGQDSLLVKMSQLLVQVKVVGNIAYTTAEMHFTNSSTRQMEAELLFPLPEGVSVSRYAIDINGKMREAVPVNKTKGKQVFEAVEHKRVDPGLLEKVDGNNFKTRIYPILPNKERIVIIGYEQELSGFDNANLAYQLLSSYGQKLDKFELTINVVAAASVPTIVNDSDASTFMDKVQDTQWNQSYTTTIKKENYQPSEKITIKIPIQPNSPSVVVQSVQGQHYFYANTTIEGVKVQKVSPKSIGLVWDVSLSCQNRDLKKELALLDAYFKALQNVEVKLYLMGYNFEAKNNYKITNGDWSLLKKELENTIYDGGTRFSKINLSQQDEYLFFSDGLSSLSDNLLPKLSSPLYTITSSVATDYAFLNYNAMKTGGSSINLNALNTTDALAKLLYQNLNFLGVKDNYAILDLYPTVGTEVSGSFSVAGISLKEKDKLILLFGYGNKPTIEKEINIDATNQRANDVNVEKLWAQKKIAHLEIQYKLNATEIETLGNKYGIVTQNTSLIVLEDINDYIQYDIVPPAELREEFDRIQKEQREKRLAEQKNSWQNVDSYFNELNAWWKKDIVYVKPAPSDLKGKKKVSSPRYRNDDNNVLDEGRGAAAPTSSAPPRAARVDEITARQEREISRRDSDEERARQAAIALRERENRASTQKLDDRERVAAATAAAAKAIRRKSESLDSNNVVTERITNEESELWDGLGDADAVSAVQALGTVAPGLQVSQSSPVNTTATDSISNAPAPRRNQSQTTKVNSWNPDRLYLKAIDAAPADKKYEAYLQLREAQSNNPSYYFDVANYFYNKGNKNLALLILSSIADLGLENHQLYKSLTYQLRQWEAYQDALYTAKQVAKWRDFEPQSHRDLGLTLEDNKEYQAAFDELIKALETNYFGTMSGQYAGVEDIILMDINRLITEHKGINTDKLDKKYLDKMPVSVRIILNWNRMDTDIDLHVIEPSGEECYYSHKTTRAGARFSKDFTRGYGPEQYLLRNALKGTFKIKTNFFGESALTQNGPTTVMVEIYTTKNGKTKRELLTIQLGKIKQNENLAEIMIE